MGGIVKFFVDVGLFVIEVVDYMGFLEMFDGCVKMFYLKVYGGIFVCCDLFEYMQVFEQYGILMIDLFVVNLYLFVVMIVKDDCMFVDVIENIDIGGLMMLCLVVKNYCDVMVVVDLVDYVVVFDEMKVNGNMVGYLINFCFVMKVFVYIV